MHESNIRITDKITGVVLKFKNDKRNDNKFSIYDIQNNQCIENNLMNENTVKVFVTDKLKSIINNTDYYKCNIRKSKRNSKVYIAHTAKLI